MGFVTSFRSLNVSFVSPQLEFTFWVSYAKRTGVHWTTGPIKLAAELKYEVECETETAREFTDPGNVPSVIMMPPRLPVCRSGLTRRPSAVWSVVHLSASVTDNSIGLRHRADLPGQLVQILLRCANLQQVRCGFFKFAWIEFPEWYHF